MSRHVADFQARRRGSQSSQQPPNEHIVEPVKPPAMSQSTAKPSVAKAKQSTGRQLPQVPPGDARRNQAPKTLSGKLLPAESDEPRARKVAQPAPPVPQVMAQAPAAGGVSSPSSGSSSISPPTGKSMETTAALMARMAIEKTTTPEHDRSVRRFSLPGADVSPGKTPNARVRRASRMVSPRSSLAQISVPPRQKSLPNMKSRLSQRRTSTIPMDSLLEQLTIRVDFHLHSISVTQTSSSIGKHKRVDFSKCPVNVSVEHGNRVDTSAPAHLKKESSLQHSPASDSSENRYCSGFQEAISLPVNVGSKLDDPGKYLGRDVRVVVEYGQRDLLSTEDAMGSMKWYALASGAVDVSAFLKANDSRFSRQQTVPLKIHQSHASNTFSCTLDFTVIGTVLQRRVDEEISQSELFSYDEDVFGYEDNQDSSEEDVEETPSRLPPSSAMSSRQSSATSVSSVSSRTSVASHKKSVAMLKRDSRVSTVDGPSDCGTNPMQTTAAFAYEGNFNRLGVLHVSVSHAKYSAPATTSHSETTKLKDGDDIIYYAEINGGLAKQQSKPTQYSQGMLMTWPAKLPQFTFYALKSRQIFLTMHSRQQKAGASSAANARGSTTRIGLTNLLLTKVPELSDKLPLTYSQPSPFKFVDDTSELQQTLQLTPSGEVTVNIAFTSLPERRPCAGHFKARSVSVCGLELPHDVHHVCCVLKVDGVFKAMSSEAECSGGSSSWEHDRPCEITAVDSVDLEVHVWGRSPSSLKWMACGVLPLASPATRQRDAMRSPTREEVSTHSYVKSMKQELWVPLEPHGFIQLEVSVSDNVTLAAVQSTDDEQQTEEQEQNSTDGFDSTCRLRESEESAAPKGPTADVMSSEKLLGEVASPRTRKKSNPNWDDMVKVLRDRLELRKEVDFLHQELRSAKAQLAESDFLRRKAELENRELTKRLKSVKLQTKSIAKKATHLELQQLMLAAEEEGYAENGYQTS